MDQSGEEIVEIGFIASNIFSSLFQGSRKNRLADGLGLGMRDEG